MTTCSSILFNIWHTKLCCIKPTTNHQHVKPIPQYALGSGLNQVFVLVFFPLMQQIAGSAGEFPRSVKTPQPCCLLLWLARQMMRCPGSRLQPGIQVLSDQKSKKSTKKTNSTKKSTKKSKFTQKSTKKTEVTQKSTKKSKFTQKSTKKTGVT